MNILIGISGGIAAYKIADLVRLFIKDGHSVKTILTRSAVEFITPTTLQTLTKNKCYVEMFEGEYDVEHVELAKWADLMIIAPATANTIGRIANGICDELLHAVLLAFNNPCYIFPSMNTNMYSHPVVRKNIKQLEKWGYLVYKPEEGELACGDRGVGRLPDINMIYETVIAETERRFIKSPLLDKHILITAGSTKSYIDPVRYISNSSSGLMGVEIVRQSWLRGAKVTLVCNKEVLERFSWVGYYADIIQVETTKDVMDKVKPLFDYVDIYISAAALSDFANKPLGYKIKRNNKGNIIHLESSVDVFSELSKIKKDQLMVGFALESDDLEDNAFEKLSRKGMDMVIANTVDTIGSKSSEVIILDKKGIRKYLKIADKRTIASQIMEEVEIYLNDPTAYDYRSVKNTESKDYRI